MDPDAIALTEEIHGEAIMPRDVDAGDHALTDDDVRGGFARHASAGSPLGLARWKAEFDRWLRQHDAEVAAKALEAESARLRERISEATEARDSFERGSDPWADFNRQILAATKSANDLMLSAERIRVGAQR